MTMPRTEQAHQRRVDRIAEEAAAKVAADSPVEEDVIVTVEEVPTAGGQRGAPIAAPLSPQRYVETVAAVANANTVFMQRVVGAQLRFAARMADAIKPGSR